MRRKENVCDEELVCVVLILTSCCVLVLPSGLQAAMMLITPANRRNQIVFHFSGGSIEIVYLSRFTFVVPLASLSIMLRIAKMSRPMPPIACILYFLSIDSDPSFDVKLLCS